MLLLLIFGMWISLLYNCINIVRFCFPVGYIRNIDGLTGCFTGLTPRLCSTFLTTVSNCYIMDKFKIELESRDEQDLNENER